MTLSSSMITAAKPAVFRDPLPEAVDVVVIGGGIAGVASAYYLARRGVRVAVVEKGRIAGEQSSRNWGWVRQQGRDPAELPIMMEANGLWQGLAGETGEADLAFTQCGCLYLAETEARLATFEEWYDVARQAQLPTRLLSKAEVETICPNIAGDFVGGMITETDGRAEPFVAVPAMARAAQRAGALIIENCAARTLDVATGRVSGVITEHGPIACSQAVLAGGVWSTHFARNAGLSLPQLAVRSTVARTAPAPDLVAPNVSMPGFALRRRQDGGYTVTTGDLAEHYVSPNSLRYLPKFLKLLRTSAKDVKLRFDPPAHFPGTWRMAQRWSGDETSPFERARVVDPTPSPVVIERIRKRLPQRLPGLRDVALAEAWAGMIDVTPDAVPMIGEADGMAGLIYATGLSGHGFGIGPAIGRIIADLVMGRSPGHDLSRFRTTRFGDGSSIRPGPY